MSSSDCLAGGPPNPPIAGPLCPPLDRRDTNLRRDMSSVTKGPRGLTDREAYRWDPRQDRHNLAGKRQKKFRTDVTPKGPPLLPPDLTRGPRREGRAVCQKPQFTSWDERISIDYLVTRMGRRQPAQQQIRTNQSRESMRRSRVHRGRTGFLQSSCQAVGHMTGPTALPWRSVRSSRTSEPECARRRA